MFPNGLLGSGTGKGKCESGPAQKKKSNAGNFQHYIQADSSTSNRTYIIGGPTFNHMAVVYIPHGLK